MNSRQNEILIIFTGGTIGSSIKNGIIAPDDAACEELLEGFRKEYGEDVTFTSLKPFSILSENVTPAELSQLCRIVEENRDKGYKGIIITYGSDTLSYATAFLGTVFRGRLTCPLVFVAGNKPLSDSTSNGFYNFAGAVWLTDYLSKSGFYNDVYAVWHDGSVFGAYRGTELTEADAGAHNHSVFGGMAFAEFYPEGLSDTGENYRWRTVINDRHDDRCECDVSDEELIRFCEKDFEISVGVAAVRSYPGIDLERICLDGLNAVLVYGYHSGTFTPGFYEFARSLSDKGIRLYAASFKKDAVAVYESVKIPDDCIKLEDMSFESAYSYVLIRESLSEAHA